MGPLVNADGHAPSIPNPGGRWNAARVRIRKQPSSENFTIFQGSRLPGRRLMAVRELRSARGQGTRDPWKIFTRNPVSRALPGVGARDAARETESPVKF